MMDTYVDYTAYTKPAIYGERLYHSASSERVVAGFAELSAAGDTHTDAQWVALYDAGARSFVIAMTKHAGHIQAVSADTSDKSLNSEKLRASIEYVYCNDEASVFDDTMSRVALRGVVDSVEDLADNREYLALDRLLSFVNPERLRPITAVAFLRSSYAVKARLSNWNGLYQVVYAHLSDIGENPKRLLRGLSVPRPESYA